MDSSSSCCVFDVEEEVVVIRNGWTPKKKKKMIILVLKSSINVKFHMFTEKNTSWMTIRAGRERGKTVMESKHDCIDNKE